MPVLKPFFIALQLLTRLPSVNYSLITPKETGLSVLFYPLVGLLIGLIVSFSDHFLSFLPINLLAVTIIVISVLMSGALHIDGLADSADAWLAGGDKDTSLRIMKDPHVGTAGVVAIVLLLLLKYVVLIEVLAKGYWLLILFTPILARTIPLFFMLSLSYVRTDGIAQSIHDFLPKKPALLILLIISTIALLLNTFAFALTAIMLLLLRSLSKKRLEGYTGDTLGAAIELTEVFYLLGFVIYLNINIL